jgi:aspartyl-tRNA(Asn)/glutamyl-tRNA(Gln) amidotransferase subunit B
VKQAIDYEISRQVEVVESGGRVKQETRLFDPGRGETRAMRSKEEAHDYRYFPEPDLPPLHVPPSLIDAQRRALPELPRAKVKRFQKDYGLPDYDARLLCADRALADYYEAAAKQYSDPKKLSNWIQGELLRFLKDEGATVASLRTTPAQLVALLGLVDQSKVSANSGKEVLAEMFRTGRDALPIVEERGLGQVSDAGAVEGVVDSVLAQNSAEVEKYRSGKKQVFGFLVGQVMRAMKGKGNPALVNELLKKKLGD